MRRRYKDSEWTELKSAFFAGGEILGLARAAAIPEGTALARAHRERWAEERDMAREAASAKLARRDISGAVALEAAERRERHLARMADLSERIGGEVEKLPGDVALHRIGQIDRYDRLTRRTLGMEDTSGVRAPLVNIALLSGAPPPKLDVVLTPADEFDSGSF